MVNGDGQHQHVHLRDRASLHSHGARVSGKNEGDHRVPPRRQHPSTRCEIFLIYSLFYGAALQIVLFTFAGGSISNMYDLMIARHKLYPQHKKHGMRAIKGQLIMYTSRHVSDTSTLHYILLSEWG